MRSATQGSLVRLGCQVACDELARGHAGNRRGSLNHGGENLANTALHRSDESTLQRQHLREWCKRRVQNHERGEVRQYAVRAQSHLWAQRRSAGCTGRRRHRFHTGSHATNTSCRSLRSLFGTRGVRGSGCACRRGHGRVLRQRSGGTLARCRSRRGHRGSHDVGRRLSHVEQSRCTAQRRQACRSGWCAALSRRSCRCCGCCCRRRRRRRDGWAQAHRPKGWSLHLWLGSCKVRIVLHRTYAPSHKLCRLHLVNRHLKRLEDHLNLKLQI
mmetsp:Transcript_13539/g.33887  ORF Transcript_13539/g.33887 Transcript_13539/m.33887 type:complete len:271 (-) Transcript_13539:2380-3192(-)